MEIEAIRAQVKLSIHQVTGIEAEAISDAAAYVDDLGLDSLSILEIAVNVEQNFKFHATDDELTAIRTVEDTVDLVRKRLYVDVA